MTEIPWHVLLVVDTVHLPIDGVRFPSAATGRSCHVTVVVIDPPPVAFDATRRIACDECGKVALLYRVVDSANQSRFLMTSSLLFHLVARSSCFQLLLVTAHHRIPQYRFTDVVS